MPAFGSWTNWALAAIVTTIGNVGGAITSAWPQDCARAGSRWTGSAAPIASANSRIFSRLTLYGAVGGYVRPRKDWSSGMPVKLPAPLARSEQASAGLAVCGVLAAAGAELLQLNAV